MIETEWKPLTEPPEGNECVVLFTPDRAIPKSSNYGKIDDVGIFLSASNASYARSNALKHGYTHWYRIPYPLPECKQGTV